MENINISVDWSISIKKYTPAEMREMVKAGIVVDITSATNTDAIPEPYTVCGYCLSFGKPYGKIFLGLETYKLYAIAHPSIALQIF